MYLFLQKTDLWQSVFILIFQKEEFDDFLVGIESIQKTIENFAFNQESYWNLKDKEISPEKHSEETSIRKLTRMQPCKRDMEWLEKHRVPFTPPANQSDDA